MKILVTGGAGYLGTVLVNMLLEQNYEVVVLDKLLFNQTSLLQYTSNPKFKFIYGDVRNEFLLQKLCNEADVIIPLAAIVGFPACAADPKLAREINFDQICNIVKFAKDKKILYPNTNSGYGVGVGQTECTEDSPLTPISVYGQTKCDAETFLRATTSAITFRLATVFGVSPRMRTDLLVNDFVYKSVVDGYLVLFEAHFKRNYIHVQDIARTFQFIIENYEKCKGHAFNVGLSTANLSKLELAEKIKSHIPSLVIKQDDFKEDFDKRNYIVSNEKLEALGWKPIYDLDYGIKQLMSAYKIVINKNNQNFTNL